MKSIKAELPEKNGSNSHHPEKKVVYTAELPTKNGIAKLELPDVVYLAAKLAKKRTGGY